jgi:hypothetical protein
VAGTNQKGGEDRGLMKLRKESIVLIDRTNLFHSFITQSHNLFYQFFFRLFRIQFDKLIIVFITANVSALDYKFVIQQACFGHYFQSMQ